MGYFMSVGSCLLLSFGQCYHFISVPLSASTVLMTGTLSLSGILCKPNTGQVIMQYKKYMGETKSSREVGVLKTDIVEFNLK
jgi:hypothetical protein